ncbi:MULTISPECIES: glycosyl transferase [Parabacteroides]|jgi:hypothetical protein|uniref:DUF998 domain-containing protein n=1 Tax=Siphoviridae sp. ct7aK2 TaxID=2825351 RepID=A0A8S5U9D1_9CAUD|nr:glycosyl transferase [Parabacteroides goldsteinii]DAF91060.1 MAG TPA: hypothetical protein [Siphoviridae sp. ct7aK2]
MMTLIIISLVIFLAYLTGTYKYFGIPYSISDTYYKLENRKKGAGWLFSAMCVSVGGLLLPALLELTPESYQFTAFLACAGLIFVGAAPQFKLPLTGSVHYGSAAVCVIFSQIWVGLTCWWVLLPVWISFIGYILYGMFRYSDFFRGRIYFIESKPMFWAEIAALGATYVTIFIK